MKKVHLNEHRGDDKNGGLSKDEPVLTMETREPDFAQAGHPTIQDHGYEGLH